MVGGVRLLTWKSRRHGSSPKGSFSGRREELQKDTGLRDASKAKYMEARDLQVNPMGGYGRGWLTMHARKWSRVTIKGSSYHQEPLQDEDDGQGNVKLVSSVSPGMAWEGRWTWRGMRARQDKRAGHLAPGAQNTRMLGVEH